MKSHGFTFIEVLFALFIVGMMALTVGYTLILSLRSEARGRYMQEGLMVLSSLQVAERSEWPIDDSAVADSPGWRVSTELVEERDGETQRVWRVNHVSHARTDFRTTIAFRQAAE